MRSVSYVTCAKVPLTRWSIFLFLDVPTVKLRTIIIILPSDRHNIILPTARTTKKLSYLRFIGGLLNCDFSLQKSLLDSMIFLTSLTEYGAFLAQTKCIIRVKPGWNNFLCKSRRFPDEFKVEQEYIHTVSSDKQSATTMILNVKTVAAQLSSPTHNFVIFYFTFLWLIKHEWNCFLINYEFKVSTSYVMVPFPNSFHNCIGFFPNWRMLNFLLA